MTNGWQIGLLWLAAICVLLIGEVSSITPAAKPAKVEIEGEWTHVKKGWPIDDKDYFISTDKGHHFVAAHVPKDLKHDLMVTFEYYYSYARARPVLSMTPCRENIDLVNEWTEETREKWMTHEYRVRHSDCNVRDELAYNVLLQDPGDVFAWKRLRIRYVIDEESTEPERHSTKLESIMTGPSKFTDAPMSENPASPAAGLEPLGKPTIPSDLVKEPTKEGDFFNPPLEEDPEFAIKPTPASDPAPASASASDPASVSASDPASVSASDPASASASDPASASASDPAPAPITDSAPASVPTSTTTKTDTAHDSLVAAAESRPNSDIDWVEGRPHHRQKRDTTVNEKHTTRQSTPMTEAVCKPSSCNKHRFFMSEFSGLINGLPKAPMTKRGLDHYVNLRNKPLKLKIKSFEESLREVDSCVDFSIYMEKDTEFEFLLEDGSNITQPRLLETVKRRADDSTASRWDEFNRCISDYMPRFTPGRSNSDNSLKFVVRPRGYQEPAQMAILMNQKKVASFRNLYPTQGFLPDIQRISDSKQLEKFWVMDRDGLNKPKLEITKSGSDKALHVSRIDPSQASFDITSRWMQIKDVEILEQKIIFVYKAENVDWVERVDFEYQHATDRADDWLSKVVYRAPKEEVAHKVNGSLDKPETSTSRLVDKQPRSIDLPIRLNGADSSEFRIRLKHYLRQHKGPGSRPDELSLNIKSLAFADACSYNRPYCQNNAKCKPTGAAQAECVCDPGYSGRFCEHVRPCDVLYGSEFASAENSTFRRGMTGHELCKSLEARCIDQLPVMRCEWRNDQYYQCKKLYKFNANSQTYVPMRPSEVTTRPSNGSVVVTDSNTDDSGAFDYSEPDEQVRHLKEVNEQQAKLIIILGVFLVSLLVFSVVLIGSMVSRLRASSSRLRKSQSEVHELSRRAQPRTFNQQQGFNSRGQIGTTGYNNSAFDVDL